MNRWVIAACAGAIIIAAHASPSHADTIYFARAGTLFRTDGKGRNPKRVTALAGKDTIVSIRAAGNGIVLLEDNQGNWHWLNGRRTKSRPTPLGCNGRATLSATGALIVCSGDARVTYIHHLRENQVRMIPVPVGPVGFGKNGSNELVVAKHAKLWAIGLTEHTAQRLLAPHAPADHLLVAPDGSRAVGRYAEGKHKRIFSFRLDGKAARRRLLRDAVPLAWSANSTWLLAQGHAGACIARAVGGHFKCWRDFQAVAISPDGTSALLRKLPKRSRDGRAPAPARTPLYVATINGANGGRPLLLVANANLAAAWITRTHR